MGRIFVFHDQAREYFKGCAILVLLEIKWYEHNWNDYACELKTKFKFEDLSSTRINKLKRSLQCSLQ